MFIPSNYKSNQLGVKSIGYTVKEELSQEAKNMLEKLNNQEKLINYRKLNFRGGNNVQTVESLQTLSFQIF